MRVVVVGAGEAVVSQGAGFRRACVALLRTRPMAMAMCWIGLEAGADVRQGRESGRGDDMGW
jgi:hypothetical protein